MLQHDCINRQATLCDPQTSASVCVDTSLAEPLEGSVGSLFQVIGEVEREDGGDTAIVRARVMRCVDGMDLLMYNRALRNQQKYFQSRNVTLIRHKWPKKFIYKYLIIFYQYFLEHFIMCITPVYEQGTTHSLCTGTWRYYIFIKSVLYTCITKRSFLLSIQNSCFICCFFFLIWSKYF